MRILFNKRYYSLIIEATIGWRGSLCSGKIYQQSETQTDDYCVSVEKRTSQIST